MCFLSSQEIEESPVEEVPRQESNVRCEGATITGGLSTRPQQPGDQFPSVEHWATLMYQRKYPKLDDRAGLNDVLSRSWSNQLELLRDPMQEIPTLQSKGSLCFVIFCWDRRGLQYDEQHLFNNSPEDFFNAAIKKRAQVMIEQLELATRAINIKPFLPFWHELVMGICAFALLHVLNIKNKQNQQFSAFALLHFLNN